MIHDSPNIWTHIFRVGLAGAVAGLGFGMQISAGPGLNLTEIGLLVMIIGLICQSVIDVGRTLAQLSREIRARRGGGVRE